MLSPTELAHLASPFEAKLPSFQRGNTATDITAEVGVYRTPEQFTEEALKLEHPFDDCSSVPDDLKRAMFSLLSEGPLSVARQRQQMLDWYKNLSAQMESAEQLLHQQLDPAREAIVHDKKLLLFSRVCVYAGVEDAGLVDFLLNGVKLTGMGDATAQFDEDIKEPPISNVQLMKSSTWTRKKILGKSNGDVSERVLKAIWDGAWDEAAKGWLSGPYTEQFLTEKLGPMLWFQGGLALSSLTKSGPSMTCRRAWSTWLMAALTNLTCLE